MKKATMAAAAVRLEDLRRLVAAVPEVPARTQWFSAQEQAMAGNGALALGLLVDDEWFRRLCHDGAAWCDETDLLSWGENTVVGAAILAVLSRAEMLQGEWRDARDMVIAAAEHQILVLAYG